MSWRAITEADILERLSGAELSALRAAALADGQADPVAGSISRVTELVRGYVAACASNTLGAVGTVPERLIEPALDLLVVAISARAGGTLMDPTGERAKAKAAAITLLEQVAACKFAVDVPATGTESEESVASASPSLSERTLDLQKTDQDGI